MTLQERVDADLKEAMRAKDVTKLGVLRMNERFVTSDPLSARDERRLRISRRRRAARGEPSCEWRPWTSTAA